MLGLLWNNVFGLGTIQHLVVLTISGPVIIGRFSGSPFRSWRYPKKASLQNARYGKLRRTTAHGGFWRVDLIRGCSMALPVSLVLLGVIALVLHILFSYLLPSPPPQPMRAVLAAVVIVLVLIFWFFVPIRIG